eukprot:jgi/Mesvir1/2615/Mv05574-RA.1
MMASHDATLFTLTREGISAAHDAKGVTIQATPVNHPSTMGVSDIFAFERKEGNVIYLKPRDNADHMFKLDKRVRLLDGPTYNGYVHAQSLCDIMANGKSEAKAWFRNNETKALIQHINSELNTSATTDSDDPTLGGMTPAEVTTGGRILPAGVTAGGRILPAETVTAILVLDGSGPSAGSWIHPKLLIPFLMWVDKVFALKAYDWVARILAGDLTLCADIARRHDVIHGTETTAVFTTAPAGVHDEIAIREETDLRIRKAKLESIAVTEEYRVRLLTALAAQQKLLMDVSLNMNDRDKLFLKDKANDILYTDLVGGSSAAEGGAPPRKSLDISTVARELGYRANLNEANMIGRAMAQRFRSSFPGKEIPKTERFVDGAVRFVNWYEDEPVQRQMMEEVVEEVMQREGKRPVKTRKMSEFFARNDV